MKLSTIFVALLSATYVTAMPSPNNGLDARQQTSNAALLVVEATLESARSRAAASYRDTTGEGRRLTSCSENCSQCRAGAITKAVAEVALCGTAALALEVVTAGTTTILEVAGFVACEAAVVGQLNQDEATCAGTP